MSPFDDKLLKAIGKKLIAGNYSVSVAESVTSGLLQFAFSNIPDGAKFFQGGITAYNIGQKYKHLAVEPLHALEVNCVSQDVAIQMALQAARMFASTWSIAITGYASPVEESGNKVYAYYAITCNGKVKKKGKLTGKSRDPFLVQRHYAEEVLEKFKILL